MRNYGRFDYKQNMGNKDLFAIILILGGLMFLIK